MPNSFPVSQLRIGYLTLSEFQSPLAAREIATRALAYKRVTLPDQRVMKTTRTRLLQFLRKLDARGVTRKVGQGNETRRELVQDAR